MEYQVRSGVPEGLNFKDGVVPGNAAGAIVSLTKAERLHKKVSRLDLPTSSVCTLLEDPCPADDFTCTPVLTAGTGYPVPAVKSQEEDYFNPFK